MGTMTVKVEKIDLATNDLDHDVAVGLLIDSSDGYEAGIKVEVALRGGVGGKSPLAEILRQCHQVREH